MKLLKKISGLLRLSRSKTAEEQRKRELLQELGALLLLSRVIEEELEQSGLVTETFWEKEHSAATKAAAQIFQWAGKDLQLATQWVDAAKWLSMSWEDIARMCGDPLPPAWWDEPAPQDSVTRSIHGIPREEGEEEEEAC